MQLITKKTELLILLLPILFLSFKTEEKKRGEYFFNNTNYSDTNTYRRNHLLFESLFDSPGNNWPEIDANASYAYQLETDTVKRNGKGSERMELNIFDSLLAGHRVEFGYLPQQQKEGWFGFSVYLPPNFTADQSPESIVQWHALPDFDLGEQHGSPPVALLLMNDRWCLDLRWDSGRVTTQNTFHFQRVDLGPALKNKWNDWVFRIKWSYGNDGILQVWKDNKQVVSLNQANSFNDRNNPYFKIGIYKWDWSSPNVSSTKKRVLYVDEVRIGDSLATFIDVKP